MTNNQNDLQPHDAQNLMNTFCETHLYDKPGVNWRNNKELDIDPDAFLDGIDKRDWDESLHPRDERGRFSGGGSEFLHGMFDQISKPDGGFTYQPVTKQSPTDGFALSIYPQYSAVYSAKDFSLATMEDYAAEHNDLFKDPANHIGGWHDPETNNFFLDVSVVTHDAKEAQALCNKHDQIAYFDLKEGHSVTVNREATSGGVVKSGKIVYKDRD